MAYKKKVLSEEHKRKIGLASIGRKCSDETREKLSVALKGKKRSKEHCKHLSESIKGFKHTEEAKKKIKDAMGGKNHPNYGKHHSEETKNKMRLKRMGFKHSEETKVEMSRTRQGTNSPNWQGGKSIELYPKEFNNELRSIIRRRDNYLCQLCFCEQKGRLHSVHHLDYCKTNNKENNLITLCVRCNSKVNGNRDYWNFYFRKLIDSKNDFIIIKEVI